MDTIFFEATALIVFTAIAIALQVKVIRPLANYVGYYF